jgi:hypothetical protein
MYLTSPTARAASDAAVLPKLPPNGSEELKSMLPDTFAAAAAAAAALLVADGLVLAEAEAASGSGWW